MCAESQRNAARGRAVRETETHKENAYRIAGNLQEMAEEIVKAAERDEWGQAADAGLGVCRSMAGMVRVWASLAGRQS